MIARAIHTGLEDRRMRGFLIAIVLVVVLTACVCVFRVDVRERQGLVGTQDAALLDLWNRRSLERIQKSVRQSGKSVDEINWLRGSLLFYAADERRVDVVAWVLSQGACPNGIDPRMAPLERAIRKGDVVSMKLLLEAGADPNLDMGGGITPEWVAREFSSPAILEVLHSRYSRASMPATVSSGGQERPGVGR